MFISKQNMLLTSDMVRFQHHYPPQIFKYFTSLMKKLTPFFVFPVKVNPSGAWCRIQILSNNIRQHNASESVESDLEHHFALLEAFFLHCSLYSKESQIWHRMCIRGVQVKHHEPSFQAFFLNTFQESQKISGKQRSIYTTSRKNSKVACSSCTHAL